jgi:hypothetical protein
MVNWHHIEVPTLEWNTARDLGAERSNGAWWCTATQYKHKSFRRWHTTASHKRVVIYPGDGVRARTEAKDRANACRWDPTTREWFVTVTADTSLKAWHRERLKPPPEYELRVSFDDKDAAKDVGCRWKPEVRRWVFACHGLPLRFVRERAIVGV